MSGLKKLFQTLPLHHLLIITGITICIPSNVLQAVPSVPVPPRNYAIKGREYKENGIIFDVPKKEDPSRDAMVVSFPNRAVIPSHINVDGIQYTVRKIYKAANTWLDDTAGWVTLPPTLKDCKDFTRGVLLESAFVSQPTYTAGVSNINVTDLDSFLNIELFAQAGYYSLAPVQDRRCWKLYLNMKQVHDIAYPEGSPIGMNPSWLQDINTITIPASDTTRREPTNFLKGSLQPPVEGVPRKLLFKATSGYDLRYYDIMADSIEFPRGMTEFHGYGTLTSSQLDRNLKVARWPDNLQVLSNPRGIELTSLHDVPKTVFKIGDINGNITYFYVNDTVGVIPENWRHLERTRFSTDFQSFIIEDSDKPLHIGGLVFFTLKEDNPKFYIGRNLIFDTPKSEIVSAFAQNKTQTMIIGPRVTELPDKLQIALTSTHGAEQNYKYVQPKYLVCMGLTPPNFNTPLPQILDWKLETALVVPVVVGDTVQIRRIIYGRRDYTSLL